ncbi:hypothetical protein HZA75_01985 [Candidatus Roizmanbacteria bacterium]|nr:hypothetical protein [Candidatus Roizmanbacteria bacterium]
MEKELASVFKYFAFFGYSPNFDDVYTFFPKKISKKQLKNELNRLKYTPVEYSISASTKSNAFFKEKLRKVQLYIKFISIFPQIKLIGLSGSMAMKNPKSEDDIDLFIITEKNRLFTARFLATIISIIMGLKRSIGQNKAPNKVCLNLFFDESNLKVPKFKQTEFVGHEVLQMKPVIVKDNIYERFLEANLWVFRLFPNSKSKIQNSNVKINPKSKVQKFGFKILGLICHLDFFILISNKTEFFLKKLQLKLINRHRTTEIITNSQLWFHPDDFEKKIKKLKG